MELTKLQNKTIQNEIKYYLDYDQILTDTEKKFLIRNVKKIYNLEDISKFEDRWMRIIIYYFLSHTNKDGEILSLEHHALIDHEIKENYQFFKTNKERFLSELFKSTDPLIFLDVDNTLTYNAELSDEKIDFIKNWSKKDNIILSTGKISKSILNVIDLCSLNKNYYSCLNGSVIHKNKDFIILDSIGEISKKIVEELDKTDIKYIIYYEDSILVLKDLEEEQYNLLDKFNELYFEEDKNVDYNRVIKLLTFIHDGEDEKEEIVKGIVGKFNNLICVRTAPHCFEILKKSQHKGNSVKKIAELMNKYYRISLSVGDSMNDLKMLDYTGYSYVVSNSSEELKKYNFEMLEGSRDIDIVELLKKY